MRPGEAEQSSTLRPDTLFPPPGFVDPLLLERTAQNMERGNRASTALLRVVARMPSGWIVLEGWWLGSPLDTPGKRSRRYALLHARIGVALIEIVPSDVVPNAVELLRSALDAGEFRSRYREYPPIVHLCMPLSELSDLPRLLDQQFGQHLTEWMGGRNGWVLVVEQALGGERLSGDMASSDTPHEPTFAEPAQRRRPRSPLRLICGTVTLIAVGLFPFPSRILEETKGLIFQAEAGVSGLVGTLAAMFADGQFKPPFRPSPLPSAPQQANDASLAWSAAGGSSTAPSAEIAGLFPGSPEGVALHLPATERDVGRAEEMSASPPASASAQLGLFPSSRARADPATGVQPGAPVAATPVGETVTSVAELAVAVGQSPTLLAGRPPEQALPPSGDPPVGAVAVAPEAPVESDAPRSKLAVDAPKSHPASADERKRTEAPHALQTPAQASNQSVAPQSVADGSAAPAPAPIDDHQGSPGALVNPEAAATLASAAAREAASNKQRASMLLSSAKHELISVLLSRGERMLAVGDIFAGRLLFERAAALGSARATTAAGKTYDPDFLASTGSGSVIPDRTAAVSWYLKAAALGDPEASRLLSAGSVSSGNQH
jgi:hypothetical protein